jgi:hypothetical protein
MCLLQTVNFVVPLKWRCGGCWCPRRSRRSSWAVRDHRRSGGSLSPRALRTPGALRDGSVLALLVVVPALFLSAPLDARNSQGPVAVGIFDSQTYVNFTEGFQNHTNKAPFKDVLFPFASHEYDQEAWGPPWH